MEQFRLSARSQKIYQKIQNSLIQQEAQGVCHDRTSGQEKVGGACHKTNEGQISGKIGMGNPGGNQDKAALHCRRH
jgi:hypothetical protein